MLLQRNFIPTNIKVLLIHIGNSFGYFSNQYFLVSRFKSVLILGHEIDMVLLPLRGNFADYDFHKAPCLTSVLKQVSPLTSVA